MDASIVFTGGSRLWATGALNAPKFEIHQQLCLQKKNFEHLAFFPLHFGSFLAGLCC
jgi:hypothetical protein